VADFLETFKTWLAVENVDNEEWIQQQWVEMFFKNYESEGWERKMPENVR
jgi:hypothetical protein